MDLEVRDLELLDALAEARTLTAAADRLYISQPALSQRLAKMEDRLGVRLFEREGRRLVPNRAGRRMLLDVVPRGRDQLVQDGWVERRGVGDHLGGLDL